MSSTSIVDEIRQNIQLLGEFGDEVQLKLISDKNGIRVYELAVAFEAAQTPKPITLKWKIPALNVKGIWKSGSLYNKRIQYDWELDHIRARISVNAPVVNVFGHHDENIITFACEDAINMVEMNALLREEDNHIYCHISLFKEAHPEICSYRTKIWIDERNLLFSETLQAVSQWWETAYPPTAVPDLAKAPLYSTWYNFHQNLDTNILLEECKIAKTLGYELIIIDDGWQTMDNNRGYDYTGDWNPDRIPDMADFVTKIHQLGMKLALWYSVPFCGEKSAAYQRFKGKFLTENHRWAPVFDPRYPEVRQYLIDKYINAVKDWDLDGFKLDFIDDFKVYPETDLTKANGRDYANVNAAVDRLMTDVMQALRSVKPNIVIEFRQQYIGPAMRKFGNMFRAFDAPNDPVSNRIRITDVKLLCGDSAPHSDMIEWHSEESVELAAVQVLNSFFGVPQMSVHLRSLPNEHRQMLAFYNHYWSEVSDVLLDGKFRAHNPISNYPILEAEKDGQVVAAIYENSILHIDFDTFERVDILNGRITDRIAIKNTGGSNIFEVNVFNCQGELQYQHQIELQNGLFELVVPAAGLIRLNAIGRE